MKLNRTLEIIFVLPIFKNVPVSNERAHAFLGKWQKCKNQAAGFAVNIRLLKIKENLMRNLDLSPLYRSIVGFDRVANLIEAAARQEHAPNWPPYNVIQTTEDDYRIEIAVACFGEADLDLEIKEGLLSVRGDKKPSTDEQKFLHRGIAERAFERNFQLADHVKVLSAELANGLLIIELKREIPESAKPRKIKIGANGESHLELVSEEKAA